MKAARWGDNDVYLGPFTWVSRDSWSHWAIVLRSRGDDDTESGQCTLRISMGRKTLIIALPHIVRPWREKVYPGWDADTIKRLGRDWYWNIDPREYGFSLHNAGTVGGSLHLSIYYGRTGGSMQDSSVQQQWGCFLPWTEWRHVRRTLYDLEGKHFWTEWDWIERMYRRHPLENDRWKLRHSWEDMCPVARFTVVDSDGEYIMATTRIEEREWRWGAKWFEWLSWFRKPMVRRSLDIDWSSETGPEKGSWKGGITGESIDMLPGELHEETFRRFCSLEHEHKRQKYRLTFVGRVA